MIKQVDNKVFNLNKFQRDIYLFRNLKNDNNEIYSDEENYIVSFDRKNMSVLICTLDNIDISLIPEIKEIIYHFVTNYDKVNFICKKELYQVLSQDIFNLINEKGYFEMDLLTCDDVKTLKTCDGYLYIPTIFDRTILSKFLYNSYKECENNNYLTYNEAEKIIEILMRDNRLYAWKNNDGKIVSMISYNNNGEEADLSHVYTIDYEKNKGCASNLIATITKEIIKEDFFPMIFLKHDNYLGSLYRKVGYYVYNSLVCFNCSREKVKIKI